MMQNGTGEIYKRKLFAIEYGFSGVIWLNYFRFDVIFNWANT